MDARQRNRTAAALACLTAAALFGASTPAGKWLLPRVPPLALAGLLYLGAAAGALPFAFHGGSARLRRRKRNLLMLGGAVLFGGGLGPVLLLMGLSLAPAGSVSLWLNLETAATALLATALFREHVDRRTWIAAGLTIAAGALLAAPDRFATLPAAALVAAACLCWGLDNNLTALIDGFTPAQTTVTKGLVAGAVNLTLALLVLGDRPARAAVLPALGVGAVCFGLSILLYIQGAQRLGATRSQILVSTSPFIGTALAWALLSEPVLPVQVGSAATMAVAAWLVLGARHEHEHRHGEQVHTHRHRHDDGHHDHVHPGLPAWVAHTHEHRHEEQVHAHPHEPDLHHRHDHG